MCLVVCDVYGVWRASFSGLRNQFKCWHFLCIRLVFPYTRISNHPFPPLLSVSWVPAFLPSSVGADGKVARLCQPWEWSTSRSWLSVVEALGCPQAPNLHVATQLLKQSNHFTIKDNFFAGNRIKNWCRNPVKKKEKYRERVAPLL